MNTTNHELSPAFEENNVPVVVSANNLYVPYAGVFIQSLIDHSNADRNYDVIILGRDISEPNKRLLQSLTQGAKNISIRFSDPSGLFEEIDPAAVETKQYPVEVYYKILAPFMLRHYLRIVVVDLDTFLKRDIAELFDADVEGFCLGAVRDAVWHGYYMSNYAFTSQKVPTQAYCADVLPMENPLNYVNSGVLVFDCEKYRSSLNVQTILQTAQRALYQCPDQDVLNLLMEGQIKFLDPAWNAFVPVNPHVAHGLSHAPDETKQAWEQAYEAPFLLHWAAKPKPWVCPDVEYGHEWWAAALKTPFVGEIIARMIDELHSRREYYRNKYGKTVAAWEPIPRNIVRE